MKNSIKHVILIITALNFASHLAFAQCGTAWCPTGNTISNGDILGGTGGANPLNIQTASTQTQPINFSTAGTQRMTIGSGGNVGIGSGFATPQNLLHVHGGLLQLTNSLTGSGSSNGLLIGMNGSSAEFKQQQNAPMLFLVISATARMNIAPGGNVAIGNGSTAGSRILDVKDNNFQLRLTYGTNS